MLTYKTVNCHVKWIEYNWEDIWEDISVRLGIWRRYWTTSMLTTGLLQQLGALKWGYNSKSAGYRSREPSVVQTQMSPIMGQSIDNDMVHDISAVLLTGWRLCDRTAFSISHHIDVSEMWEKYLGNRTGESKVINDWWIDFIIITYYIKPYELVIFVYLLIW